MTIAVIVDPAVAMAMHDVRAADYTADDATDDRAGRSGNDGAGARTDSDAFQCSGLGRDGRRRQHQNKHSSLEDRSHGNLFG